MSRNASTTRALLRSKSRLPSDLLHDSDPAVSKLFRSVEPLQSQSPLTTTITNVNSSKNNASSCSRRPSSVVRRPSSRPASLSSSLRLRCCWGRVWGVTCLVNVHTHFLSPAPPTLHASLLPLGPSPPPPPALVNLYTPALYAA